MDPVFFLAVSVPAAAVACAAWFFHRKRTDRRHCAALKEEVQLLAHQIIDLQLRVAQQAPAGKAAAAALAALTDVTVADRIRKEEQRLDALVLRARVLAGPGSAAAQALGQPARGACELRQRLQLLQADAARMRGISDTFEAALWVLQGSEQAIRRVGPGAAASRSQWLPTRPMPA